MSPQLEKVLKIALEMPAEDRAALADELILSVDQEVEAAWREEIGRRVKEIDEGTVALQPWDEVFARLRAKHGSTS